MPVEPVESSLVVNRPDYQVILGHILLHHRPMVIIVYGYRAYPHEFTEVPVCHKLCAVICDRLQVRISTPELIGIYLACDRT